MKRKGKASDVPGQPSKATFVEYAQSRGIDSQLAGDQWEMWDAGEWCDGDMTPIRNWKLKLVTFEKNGFGAFTERRQRSRRQPPRATDRATEAQEEYEQRQRHKPSGL
jgi:hypothetical protein